MAECRICGKTWAAICDDCHLVALANERQQQQEQMEKLKTAAKGIFDCIPEPVGNSTIEDGDYIGMFEIYGNRLNSLKAVLEEE